MLEGHIAEAVAVEIVPSSWLRFGVIGKDLNQPTFDAPGGLEYKLTPQVRGGLAVNPWSTMTITADMDITSNQTLVPGLKSQLLSLGMEQTILSEFLSFRVGTYKNVQDAGSIFTPTAGLGIRIYSFRMGLARVMILIKGEPSPPALLPGSSKWYTDNMFVLHDIRRAIALCLLQLLVVGCGGLQEVWEGPGAGGFRPQAY